MSKEVDATARSLAGESDPPSVVEVEESFWLHKRALVYCSIVCLGAFQLGLDIGAIQGLQAMPGFLMVFGEADPTSVFGYNISPTVQQLISSLISIGAFISCVAVGPLGHFVGRKWGLALGIVLNNVSVIMMMLADNLATLYAARLIAGLAAGFLDVYPQLYIHECAAVSQRASLLGWFNVCLSLGMLIGAIVDNYTSTLMTKASYQIPLGVFFIVPNILAVLLFFVPESPRWLADHGRADKARVALRALRSADVSAAAIDAELADITDALTKEKELARGISATELARGANLRRTTLSVLLMFCLAGTGSSFLLAYGTYFFAMAGQDQAFEEIVGTTTAGLVGTIVSLWLVTVVGRRTILLLGAGVQCVCMLIIAAVYTAMPASAAAGNCLVAFVVIYIFFYNMCSAPYYYLVSGEMPSQRLRGYTLGLAVAMGFVGNWLITFTAPYFINTWDLNWGPKYCWIWFPSNLLIFLFLYVYVPETRHRSLEELDEMFERRLPARQFAGHVCSGARAARDAAGRDEKDVSAAATAA